MTTEQAEALNKAKNPTLYLVVLLFPVALQYFEPVIDHWTGQDTQQVEVIREEIDAKFSEIDTKLDEGQEWLTFIDSNMTEIQAIVEARRQSESKNTFAVGLRADSSGNVFYIDTEGHRHEAMYDPFTMWFKYRDQEAWKDKAAFFETEWQEFQNRQFKLVEAVNYYESSTQ